MGRWFGQVGRKSLRRQACQERSFCLVFNAVHELSSVDNGSREDVLHAALVCKTREPGGQKLESSTRKGSCIAQRPGEQMAYDIDLEATFDASSEWLLVYIAGFYSAVACVSGQSGQ